MQLFDHQKTGIVFLKEKKKAILGDDMGLGKTRQAVIAAGETSGKNILVVCPASLKINWEREIHMVYPEDEVYIFGNDEGKEKAAWKIINYDILEKYWDSLTQEEWGTIILDESHYIKGNSKRAKYSIDLCRKAEQAYLLSGTMVQNRPIEMWNQLVAINHHLTRAKDPEKLYWPWVNFGQKYCAGFKAQYRNNQKPFWDFTGASNLGELRRQLDGYYLRRKKEDILDMPPKIRSIIPVSITKEWRAKYDTAFDDYIQWIQDHPEILEEKDMDNIFMVQHLVELGKVREVASNAIVTSVAEQINEMIDAGEKVIVFTSFESVLGAYKKAVKRCRKVELTGSTTQRKRQEVVDQFQNDPDTKVFFGNIKAAGVGITLTAASKVIFPDPDWNPAMHDQAEDRAHRIGQNGTVNVYYFTAEDTVHEDIVIEMHKEKRAITDAIQEGTAVKDQGRGSASAVLRRIGQKVTNS